jgi:hypothetical protein
MRKDLSRKGKGVNCNHYPPLKLNTDNKAMPFQGHVEIGEPHTQTGCYYTRESVRFAPDHASLSFTVPQGAVGLVREPAWGSQCQYTEPSAHRKLRPRPLLAAAHQPP